MKRQRNFQFLAAILSLGLLSGCAQTQEAEQLPFTLQMALVGDIQRLDPIYATSIEEQTLLSNLYDNLMSQTTNPDGTMETTTALAKTVDTVENIDGTTTYTFTLRRAYWSDGQAITAEDFVYAWQRLVNPTSNSSYSSLLSMVAGYSDVIATGDPSALAVTAVEDDVLEVVITGENDWFLQEVCTAIATLPLRQDVVAALKENAATGESWSSDLEALVTCGAYYVSSDDNDTILLTAYESYYATNATAEEITVLLTDDANTAWSWYEEQLVSFVWPVPNDIYSQLLEQEITYAVGSMLDMTYVAINNADEILQDFSVRQALSQAVDFTAVAQSVGVQAQVAQGIVPVGISEAGQPELGFRHAGPTLDTDPDTYASRQVSAQLSLAASLYPSDDPDYTLELLYLEEGHNKTVATTLCQQWKTVLGITITPVAVDAATLKQAMTDGTYQLALSSFIPMVNDPEPYLSPWVSTSRFNTLYYENSAYDTLLTIATTAEASGRLGCLHDAEALILEDFALIPLYSTQTGWLLQEGLVGITRDSRGWFNFATITAV